MAVAYDVGVSLESYDPPPPACPRPAPWAFDVAAADLRRLERKLRPNARFEVISATPHSHEQQWSPDADDEFPVAKRQAAAAPRTGGAMLILWTGVITMLAGATAVSAQAAGAAGTDLWRAGMAAAIVGEGLFTAGLLWLANQTSQHSHALRREVDALRGQLAAIDNRCRTPGQPRPEVVRLN